MASIEDFDDDDWRATLAELRLLVVSAGFAEWDASMAAALDEEEGDRIAPHYDLVRYAKSFADFLRVRSAENLGRMRGDFEALVTTEDERQVIDVRLRDERDERGISLFEGPTSDGLIRAVKQFVDAILEDTGYFDDSEFDA